MGVRRREGARPGLKPDPKEPFDPNQIALAAESGFELRGAIIRCQICRTRGLAEKIESVIQIYLQDPKRYVNTSIWKLHHALNAHLPDYRIRDHRSLERHLMNRHYSESWRRFLAARTPS